MCSQRRVVSAEQPVWSQQPFGWVEEEETQPRAHDRRRQHRGIRPRGWSWWQRAEQPTSRRALPGMWRPVVWLPLQRAHMRRVQGVLPEKHHQERRVPMQVRQQLRNRHVHEAEVPGMSVEKMPNRRHEA